MYSKNSITENIAKIVFSLPSLRILQLISASMKELYKNYLRLKNPCFDMNLEGH